MAKVASPIWPVQSSIRAKQQTTNWVGQYSPLCNGHSADDILQMLRLDEGTVSYDEIKKSLNNYFAERRNVIVERAHFNKRSQKPGESVETFIQDLYRLADNCNYSALRDDLFETES